MHGFSALTKTPAHEVKMQKKPKNISEKKKKKKSKFKKSLKIPK